MKIYYFSGTGNSLAVARDIPQKAIHHWCKRKEVDYHHPEVTGSGVLRENLCLRPETTSVIIKG